ncbi:hypothetical protein [Bacillus sp. NTK034]|uniref:hypothetical protein n=1 Tax=Bacillus sp. NTK034 TaxID=2802176 RepID=UPI001A8E9AB8|nr:hypothetical protein [Bacillus sp. NTK034]MBN8200476.1 hypothetical protein [Bacillus sp. NTK034]
MGFEKLTAFSKKVSDLADKPNQQLTAGELKAYFDSSPEEVRVYLNKLIDELKASTASQEIGVSQFSSNPADLQGTLEWLKEQIDFTMLGQVPDGSITPLKLSTDAKNATNISASVSGLTGDNVQQILTNLFQYANNGKTDIAGVIGSPATSGETFAQLKTHIQNSKNTLATNLTNKGQVSSGTESLTSLVGKVANVNTGKRFASGSVTVNNNDKFTVNGLSFKPSYVLVYSGGEFIAMGPKNSITSESVFKVDPTTFYNGVFTTTSDGFNIQISNLPLTNYVANWIAYE